MLQRTSSRVSGSSSSRIGAPAAATQRQQRRAASARPRARAVEVAATAAAGAKTATGATTTFAYHEIELTTGPGITVHNIMPQIRELVARSGVRDGFVNVLSRHTTTAVCVNEYEERLLDDIRQFLRRLAPPGEPYLHNDLHLRAGPPGWPGGDEAWRAQEPVNAHSHLLSIVLGNSETVPVAGGELKTGQWQSVLLVELDGPRKRSVGVQIVGAAGAAAGDDAGDS